RVPHVELDPECLPAGDEATADHEQGLDQTERDDQRGEQPELVAVVGTDRPVDHAPGDRDDRNLYGLRTGCEHDGQPKREPVRAQKTKQPDERAAVGRTRGWLAHRPTLAPGKTIAPVTILARFCCPWGKLSTI